MKENEAFEIRLSNDAQQLSLGDPAQYVWMFHHVPFSGFKRGSILKTFWRTLAIIAYIGWPWALVLISEQFTNAIALLALFVLLPVQLFFAFLQNRLHTALGTPQHSASSYPEIFTALGATIFLVGHSSGALGTLFIGENSVGFIKGALYMIHHIVNTMTFGIVENLGYSISPLEPVGWRGRWFETATILFIIYSVVRFISDAFFANRSKEIFIGTAAQVSGHAAQRGGLEEAYVSRVAAVRPAKVTHHRASELSNRLNAAEGLETLLARVRDPMFGTYLLSVIFGSIGTGRFGVRYWVLKERDEERVLIIHHTKFIPHMFSRIVAKNGRLFGQTQTGTSLELAKFDIKNLPVDWSETKAVLLYVHKGAAIYSQTLELKVN